MAPRTQIKKIGILTGGGDCPGLNAVIRAVTRSAINNYGWEVVGIEDGFEGLLDGRFIPLSIDRVSGILQQGGTMLGAASRINPFLHAVLYPRLKDEKVKYKDASRQILHFFKKGEMDALVCVGGDGTVAFAKKFSKQGMPIIAIPKTIDNDVPGTERTVGFYTAVDTATEAIDKLHTTAASHHRVMVVEVMGRHAGWLALASGVAGGANIVLIPEIPFQMKKLYARLKMRWKKLKRAATIIVVAEGAHPVGHKPIYQQVPKGKGRPGRLGGVAHWLAAEIQKNIDIDARAVVLGHILRGGSPIYQDRLLATSFGCEATKRLAKGESGTMVVWQKGAHLSIPLQKVPSGFRLVPQNDEWVKALRSMGVTFASRQD